MDVLSRLVNTWKLGRICQICAGIITGISILQIFLALYGFWQTYTNITPPRLDGMQSPFIYASLLPSLSSIMQNMAVEIFLACLLYTLGTFVTSLFAPPKKSDVTIEELDEEELEGAEATIVNID